MVRIVNISLALLILSLILTASFRPSEELFAAFERKAEQLFKVGELSFSGERHLSLDRLYTLLGMAELPWIWNFSAARVAESLEADPWVKSAQVDLSFFPPQVEVSIEEEQPWLVAEFENDSWLVSESGELIEPVARMVKPETIVEISRLARLGGIEVESELDKGVSYSENARFSYAIETLKLLQSAGGLPFEVARYELLQESGLLVEPTDFVNNPSILLKAESFKQARGCLGKLELILADLKKRGERARKVDLRFENQAIVE